MAGVAAAVAARTPAPGGGSAAAWACAMAAALVEMSASFTRTRGDQVAAHERMAQIEREAAELRAQALVLAERELHAYEPVLDALQLDKSDPGRPRRLEQALSDAAQTPLEICRTAASVARLAAEAAQTATPHLRGDARAGLELAAGACRAAAGLVEINLASNRDDPRLAEVGELRHAVASPDSA